MTPEYDGKWFVYLSDQQVVEADTLAQLKAKLGRGYRLTGYYPEGYDRTRVEVAEIQRPKRDVDRELAAIMSSAQESTVLHVPEEPVRVDAPVSLEQFERDVRVKPRQRRYDHDKILDLWAAGRTGPEIGLILSMPNWKRVGDIIATARLRGDPRAVVRNKSRSL